MKKLCFRLAALIGAAYFAIPDLLLAAGDKADMLIVVADSRKVDWSVTKYFLDVYNTNPFMFGVWCTVLTLIMGCSLGLITDRIMRHTGLDLTSRKIIEH